MTQSITNPRREYPEAVYDSFGLILADEVHRYAAEVWQSAIAKFPAANRLSLTATPYRSDGLWPVIEAHFGKNQVVLQGQTLIPEIHKVTTSFKHLFKRQAWMEDMHVRAKLLNVLTANESRNDSICRLLKKAFDAGRKVLVISERRSQLDFFRERLEAYGITDVGMYVGGRKMHLLDEAATKAIVLTTYQMAKEGLNIPSLDVLIMASPQSQIQQTVGRILRVHDGKSRPMVIDYVDPEVVVEETNKQQEIVLRYPYNTMWMARMRQYNKLGYEIVKKGK